MKTIGERIKQIRRSRGLSLTDLAKRCKISKAYLSQLENGHNSRPSAEFVVRICRALGCSIQTVLGSRELESTAAGLIRIPASLRTLAREENLGDDVLTMLSQIFYNGRQPSSIDAWRSILETIRKSTASS